ncbi:MAG: MATE family efflux transporter [Muribaculaceae bacterium]|nr:MATE family efflux transporter [Muribaculaceae bacterium]MDE6531930.1 MATE family efflux transporter [Muribaculaceae bacterium]
MNINREILRLSVPAVVSNITVPLLGLCDTGISGHLGSERFLAAIAVGSMMLNVVFWLFGFLRMGTTGLTAKAYGAGDDHQLKEIFSCSVFIATVLGMLLIAFREPVLRLLLVVVQPEADIAGLVRRYFEISIGAAPAMLCVMAVSGWFVGMQTTFWPMVIAISVNVINIAASFILVFYVGCGFKGVAIGTFIANWAGAFIAILAAWKFRRGKGLVVSVLDIGDAGLLLRFFKVNVNLFFRSFCIISVSLAVTAAGARLGSMTLAVNAVMMQFFTLFSFFMDGFAFSGEALVGRCYGARDVKMLTKSVNSLLVWSLCVALLFTLIYVTGYGCLVDVLTDEDSVRAGVRAMSIWIWLLPLVSVWAFIYDGFYVGITDTGSMLIATLLSTLVFMGFAFVRIEGGAISIGVSSNNYLWFAFMSYLFLRGLILSLMWRRRVNKSCVRGH